MSSINVTVTTEATVPTTKAKKPRKLSAHGIELRVKRMLAAKAKAKELYEECDRIEAELIVALGSNPVTLTDGRVVRVNNNFIDKNGNPRNVSYRPCGVKLLEVVVK